MASNLLINVYCLGAELGRIGFNEDRNVSFFQYKKEFLDSGKLQQLFPLIIRRIAQPQVFSRFAGQTFQSLPPMFADSLPEAFGNTIYHAWMQVNNISQLNVLQQLTYVGRRGMGALEYLPEQQLPENSAIDISEIAGIAAQVVASKEHISGANLDSLSLMNIFRVGTSAGGVRPKVLVSQHKTTGALVPGDITVSNEYHHYLIKLGINEGLSYSREVVEYIYYKMATSVGIDMMPARLIDDRHFAVLRFDRQHGSKQHVLTATGIAGLDHKAVDVSTWENLFDLALYLKLPYRDIEQLYRRMVFNVLFANTDDHLKNHSFIYHQDTDGWSLAPAYDITYSLNPEVRFTRVARALSINGKRMEISKLDLLQIADKYTIRQPMHIMEAVSNATEVWQREAPAQGVPTQIVRAIQQDFVLLQQKLY